MSRFSSAFLVVLLSFVLSATALAATYGDLNCDSSVNVVDVQISIIMSLGVPLSVIIDADQSGMPDACDDSPTATCGIGTLLSDGSCVIDPEYLKTQTDASYVEGYADGLLEGAANSTGYSDGYNDALGMCVDLGGTLGICTNYDDITAINSLEDSAIDAIQVDCLQTCLFAGDQEICLADCIATQMALSIECGTCYADEVLCQIENCLLDCIDPNSEDCASCASEFGCAKQTPTCSGIPAPPDPGPVGACLSEADQEVLESADEELGGCLSFCVFSPDATPCYLDCFLEAGMSDGCASCNSEYYNCVYGNCLQECVTGEDCDACSQSFGCPEEFESCAFGSTTPPDPETITTCLDLYNCGFVNCGGDPECSQNCADAATDEALVPYDAWLSCVIGYSNEDGEFESDGMSILGYYFLCADSFASCIGPDALTPQGNCSNTTNCVADCTGDAQCIADCFSLVSYDAAPNIAAAYTCAFEICTTIPPEFAPLLESIFQGTADCMGMVASDDSPFASLLSDGDCSCGSTTTANVDYSGSWYVTADPDTLQACQWGQANYPPQIFGLTINPDGSASADINIQGCVSESCVITENFTGTLSGNTLVLTGQWEQCDGGLCFVHNENIEIVFDSPTTFTGIDQDILSSGLFGEETCGINWDITGTKVVSTCPTALIVIQEGEQVIPGTNLHLNSGQSSIPGENAIASWEWKVSQPDGSYSQLLPSSTFDNPTFQANMAGSYDFELTVTDSQGVPSCVPAYADVVVIPDDDIHVELVWVTEGDENPYDTGPEAGADVDLHFAHGLYAASGPDLDGDGQPDPWFDQPWDAFWFNANPQWGSFDPTIDDNPSVVIDDTDGWGPEIITLNNPENTFYRVGVHYWHDHDYGDSIATLRVYISGVLAFQWEKITLVDHDMWDVGIIAWPSGLIQQTCESTAGGLCIPKITPEYQNPFFFQP